MSFDDFSTKVDRVRKHLGSSERIQEVLSVPHETGKRYISFKFKVAKSDQVNAFAIPGGYVYVTTEILRTAENEAQLASVLAHEIAHINKRHSVEAIKQATLA